jgi:hypothetical protein
MMFRFQIQLFILCCLITSCKDRCELSTERLSITWNKADDGYKIGRISVEADGKWKSINAMTGEYTVLYSASLSSDTAHMKMHTNTGVPFPEDAYHYQREMWKDATNAVSMNIAGTAYHFFPEDYQVLGDQLQFSFENDVVKFSARWATDPEFASDVIVTQTLVARKDGYYSVASPTLVNVAPNEMAWATIPGYFQGNTLQSDSVLSYAYGHGVPVFPAIYRERCITTMSSILDTRDSISIAVTPEASLVRSPWVGSENNHKSWNVALSHMSRKGVLSPTMYYPVLGESKSKLAKGDSLTFSFRFSLIHGNWFDNLKHTANDVFKFSESLVHRLNKVSLSTRIEFMHRYLTDQKTSMWNIDNFDGYVIGAQSYLGGVVGSNGDAMKNADYGAMWMLGKISGDKRITEGVLPFARNFKLAQQEISSGFFNGAAIGQYYLRKQKKFVEEWGEFVEPVGLTYYTMLDVGNILLFEPDDVELQERLRAGAERLLQWQHQDGSWEVAYDKKTTKPVFNDLKDLRPTFYGLLVAYRILKDQRYLDGAVRGADWLIKEGVEKGHFIGVCGDARYAPDFATAQSAQAFLDLYDITKELKYRDAAVATAKLYTTSIYTHPISSTNGVIVKGEEREAWEISQSGLSFEHGGIFGSAQRHGPIQLASHAPMFVRIFEITGDSIFIDMARAASIGRDAFVDQQTQVASYYWDAMNKGAGPYPHHAWWQIGWITDYLLSEAKLRSNGHIAFPRGFVTPKVGPHQSYGFANGTVYGEEARLCLGKGFATNPNPNMETILAASPDERFIFVILLNDIGLRQRQVVHLNPAIFSKKIKSVYDVRAKNEISTMSSFVAELEGYGLSVYKVELMK